MVGRVSLMWADRGGQWGTVQRLAPAARAPPFPGGPVHKAVLFVCIAFVHAFLPSCVKTAWEG